MGLGPPERRVAEDEKHRTRKRSRRQVHQSRNDERLHCGKGSERAYIKFTAMTTRTLPGSQVGRAPSRKERTAAQAQVSLPPPAPTIPRLGCGYGLGEEIRRRVCLFPHLHSVNNSHRHARGPWEGVYLDPGRRATDSKLALLVGIRHGQSHSRGAQQLSLIHI